MIARSADIEAACTPTLTRAGVYWKRTAGALHEPLVQAHPRGRRRRASEGRERCCWLLAAILDYLFHSDHRQPVQLREVAARIEAAHRSIWVHQLAYQAHGFNPSELTQIDRRFSVSAALECATGLSHQRE